VLVKDTLVLVKDVSHGLSVGQIVVSVLLVLTIIVTVYWNIRNENRIRKWNKRIDEWNKRNEEMRVLPFLSLELERGDGKYEPSFSNGWFITGTMIARNSGTGPIINLKIDAKQQGADEIKISDVPKYLGVGEGQKFKLQSKNTNTQTRKDKTPKVEIEAHFKNILGNLIQINYEWVPPDTDGTVSPPRAKLISRNGEEISLRIT